MANLAYLRVSTDAQDVANQKHGIEAYAQKNGLEKLEFYEDTQSGKKNWRQRQVGKILDLAKKDDVLIVSEISRLARSTLQVLEILQECANRGIAVHIVKSNMIMDGSLNSRITAVVLGLAAEIEREFISARTTEALAKRKAAGLPLGRPKGSKNENKKLDSKQAEIIAMLKKGVHKTSICRLIGCSPTTLYEWLHENGFERTIDENRGKNAKRKTN